MEGMVREAASSDNEWSEFEAESITDTAQLGEQQTSGKDQASSRGKADYFLDPLTKASIIYSILPKEVIAVVAQSLSPDILNNMLKSLRDKPLTGWKEEVIQAVVDEFLLLIGRVLESSRREKPSKEPLGPGAEEEAESQIQPKRKEWFSYLEHLDREWLLELLVGENPQVIAVVLSYVNREQAAYILSHLPLDQRAEVVERMVKMGNVVPTVLDSLEGILKERLKEFVYGVVIGEKAGSIDQVAQILNQLDEADVQTILERIAAKDQAMAKELESKLLTFDDLKMMDNRDLQRLLRSVDMNQLALALKGASEEMRQKVFANLSTRAKEVLQDELEALGPKRLSQIEKAQRSIVEQAKELSRSPENPITLPRLGGGDVVVQ